MNKINKKLVYIFLMSIILLSVIIIYISNRTSLDNKPILNNKNNSENIAEKGSNGKAHQLAIKKTEEEKVYGENDGETTLVDFITIEDFKIIIPSKLKEIGYKINLTNNNTVINITSNDNSYNCKIARFSNEQPYKLVLTEEQKTELNNIYREEASKACSKLGISKNNEKYYDIFYDEYLKIDSTNENVLNFYKKYNINKYTGFEGFSIAELSNAWELIDVDPNNFPSVTSISDSTDFSITYYKEENRILYRIEYGGNSAFKGLFLVSHTYSKNSTLLNSKVDFWSY